MYSSKIKEIWENIHSISYNKDANLIQEKSIKSKNGLLFLPNFEKNKDKFPLSDFYIISEFFISKFEETSRIFSKFSHQNFFSFIYLSKLSIYNPDTKIFYKEEMCNTYNFILKGDVDLYQDEHDNKINNTLISGNVYGHLIKDKYNFLAKAKNEVVIVHIIKSTFDKLIMEINEKIKIFKSNFIQKFFPKIRTFSGDMLIKILAYFERIKYKKFDIILNKNKFNDYIFLIISGEVGYSLESEDILKDNNDINKDNNYIILEKLLKGDIIGINSALEGDKNKCNCIVLSKEAEFYRISKEDLLYFFKKRDFFGDELVLDIKSIGDLQNMSLNNKITFLKNNSNKKEIINKFLINIEKNTNILNDNYTMVYDDPIDNILYQKWRNVKLGLDEMKNKLIGQKKKRIDENKKINNKDNEGNYRNINNLNKNKNLLDMYKVTNGKLNLKLNNNQIKSLNKFNDIYGIKNDNNKTKKENKEIKLDEEEKEKTNNIIFEK